MAAIIFYEKTGCINNRKIKQILMRAGHELDVRNLLTESWSAATLSPYLDSRGAQYWVNSNHPDVKANRLCLPLEQPEQLIDMLCADPLLIRRPLIQVENRFYQGVDASQLRDLIDPTALSGNYEDCPKTSVSSSA